MSGLTTHERAMQQLSRFRSARDGVELSQEDAAYLIKRGYVIKVPPTKLYMITEAGRSALQAAQWAGVA